MVGLDEAYLDLTGLFSPRAAMRRLVAEIKEATELTCSVGIGPNKLVAKVASDAEKPAGLRRAHARAGVCALCAVAARSAARDRTEDRRAPDRAGPDDARGRRRGARADAVERFGPNLGASCDGARASSTTARSAPPARSSPSRASAHSTATSTIPRTCARPRSDGRASCARASLAHARRGRTIGIKVRLDDFYDRHARAHAQRADLRRASRYRAWRCSCCASTRPRGRCGCSACASPGLEHHGEPCRDSRAATGAPSAAAARTSSHVR